MGKTESHKKSLLEALGKIPKSKKELKDIVKGRHPEISGHDVKKALRKLEESGEIEKDGKRYRISAVVTRSLSEGRIEKPLPIAMQIRKETRQADKKSVTFGEPEVDLDDEIRRLERELEAFDSSDDDSSSHENEEQNKGGIMSLSKFANDHTDQLPKSCLPEPGRYSANSEPVAKKKAKRKDKPEIDEQTAGSRQSNGLKEAVQEVLDGYKARSSERLPFYCRFCAKQYNSHDDFFEHKQTEFHQTAVAMERKATYCRLCLKQLTSPAQMKEHLASRPHKERLQSVRKRQRGAKKKQGDPRRQWC